jgi:hypothetical protein
LATITVARAGFGWFAKLQALTNQTKTNCKDDFARMLAEAAAKTDREIGNDRNRAAPKADTRLDSLSQRLTSDLTNRTRASFADLTKALSDTNATSTANPQGYF